MQFDAFAYPAFEQVVSHVAKMRNRTRGAVRAAAGHPGPVRRRHRRRRAPLRLLGVLLRPHARPARARPGERRRRLRACCARRSRRPTRSSSSSPRSCTGPRRRSTSPRRCPASAGRGRPRGHRRHADRLRPVRAGRAGGRRGRRPGGPQPAGGRPALDRALRRRDRLRRRARPPAGRWWSPRPPGFASVVLRDRRPGDRALLPLAGRAGPARDRLRHPLSRRRSSSTSSCPAWTGSSTPSTTCSGSDVMSRRRPSSCPTSARASPRPRSCAGWWPRATASPSTRASSRSRPRSRWSRCRRRTPAGSRPCTRAEGETLEVGSPLITVAVRTGGRRIRGRRRRRPRRRGLPGGGAGRLRATC